MIRNPRGREMRFTAFGRDCYGFLQRLPGLRDTGRSVISPKKVKLFVGPSKLTVGEIKCWVMCHSLIQQMYSLAGLRNHPCVERLLSQRLLAAQITIVGNKIGCRWLLDRCFLCW